MLDFTHFLVELQIVYSSEAPFLYIHYHKHIIITELLVYVCICVCISLVAEVRLYVPYSWFFYPTFFPANTPTYLRNCLSPLPSVSCTCLVMFVIALVRNGSTNFYEFFRISISIYLQQYYNVSNTAQWLGSRHVAIDRDYFWRFFYKYYYNIYIYKLTNFMHNLIF